MTPASIRARIAASDGSDQASIIEAAFLLFIPEPEGATQRIAQRIWRTADARWDSLSERFYKMIEEAEAHTDAALLIAEAVLPGWFVMSGQLCCRITSPNAEKWTLQDAPNRALAIIDAVCAAVERKDETNG